MKKGLGVLVAGFVFYIAIVLSLSLLPATHINKAPFPSEWPSQVNAPNADSTASAATFAGHWQGSWGGELAVMLKQNIDMRLVIYPPQIDSEQLPVYLSLAPHVARNELQSEQHLLATRVGEMIELNDESGGYYKFELQSGMQEGVLKGFYRSPYGDESSLKLFPLAANARVIHNGDRGQIHGQIGSIKIDDFGVYLMFVSFWDALFQSLVYFTVCGISMWFFYRRKRIAWAWRKIQAKRPKASQYKHELMYSAITMLIFGLSGGVLLYDSYSDLTPLYSHVGMYGWGYYCVSLVLVFILHDTYFYWSHRAMHTRLLYPLFHKGHHRSVSPTPFATWAFMPLEAVVQAAYVPLIVWVLPLHYSVVVIFYSGMFLRSMIGHCGYEVYPQIVVNSRWYKWIATVSHHDMHHHYFHHNFGIYFTWWDKWMGTEHPDYEASVNRLYAERASGQGLGVSNGASEPEGKVST